MRRDSSTEQVRGVVAARGVRVIPTRFSNPVGVALNSLLTQKVNGIFSFRLSAAPKRLHDGVSLVLPVQMDVPPGGLHRIVASHHRWWGRRILDHHSTGTAMEELFYRTVKSIHANERVAVKIVSQGKVISEACPDCEPTAATEIVQRLINGHLRWSASRSCKTCGLQEEAECAEEGMSRMRQLLIEDSAFSVSVGGASKAAVMAAVMAAMRSVTSLPMQEASKQAADILDGCWRGTHPEATQLANALADRGHWSEVQRVTT